MRKLLFILISALLFIVGCSNDSNDEVKANASLEELVIEQDQEEFDYRPVNM